MNSCKQEVLPDKHVRQQRAKAISYSFATAMAVNNRDSPLKKSYDNTSHCASVKVYDGEKLVSTYCKNRWCQVCNRIRIAVNVSNYGYQLSEMVDPYFVTLTRPTVTIEELPNRIREMENVWRAICVSCGDKRSSAYKEGVRLKGVRSVECTLRPNDLYHYHVHLIVDGQSNAQYIIKEWLNRNSDSNREAQDMRPADVNSLSELFKYSVKLDVKKLIYSDYKRLDSLFMVLKGKRMLSTFGGIRLKKITEKEFNEESQSITKEMKLKLGDEVSVWTWNKLLLDWVNKDGDRLIGKDIPDEILELIGRK